MKKRSLLLILFCFLVAAMTVSANDFIVDVSPVDDRLDTMDEFAVYVITIKNLQSEADHIHLLHQQDTRWSMQVTGSRSPYLFRNEEVQIRVILKPRVDDLPNAGYQIKFSFESENTGEVKDVYTKLYIGPDLSKLKPDVDVFVDVPERMDPRQSHSLKVHLVNKNQLVLDDIAIAIDSKFLSEDTLVGLNSNEEKTASFTVSFPEDKVPESESVHVKVTLGNYTFFDESASWAVVSYVLPFKKEVETEKGFLTRTKVLSLTNEGNTRKDDQDVLIETSAREKFFSKTTPKAEVVEMDGRKYLKWVISLDAGETTEVRLKTAYWWPLILIILIAAIYIAYIMLRDPVVVRKRLMNLRKEHGAFAEAKIVVHVKNRSRRPLNNVNIVERIPSMLALKKEGFRPMNPSKAYPHVSHGHVLEYNIGSLDAHEERIFSYVIKSRMKVVGNFRLKPTVVNFVDAGKKGKVLQGALNVVLEQKK